MRFTQTELGGAWLIELEPRVDDRGFFARTLCMREFSDHGLVLLCHKPESGPIESMT